MDREDIVHEVLRRRVCAIIRTGERGLAADAIKAVVAGGFRWVEFTLTTPDAMGLITEFSRDKELLVGAGTVMSPAEARAAVESGARFLVSPHCDPAVIAEARALGVVSIPGTFTATEMIAAHRCGADFVKLFPAPADIPGYVRSILAPLAYLRIVPTNGVTPENFLDILRAGAVGVGFNTHLFTADDLAAHNFVAIERRASGVIRRLEEAWQGHNDDIRGWPR